MTLFSVLFGNPIAMVSTAAAAASVPIIIHLLNRRRFKTVDWAAMRFLLAAEKKNARKLRVEQLLLLLIRIFILVLLALAMSSVMGWAEKIWSEHLPESFGRSSPSGRRTHRIIVVDGSFSMGTRVGGSTFFERARKTANDIVEKGNSGDGYSVLLMGESPRRVVPGISDNQKKVQQQIAGMFLPHGNSDLETTFESVADLLKQSPSQYVQKEVYFLTDLQRASWELAQPGRVRKSLEAISNKARAVLVDVGREVTRNLALTNLELNAPVAIKGAELTFLVSLQNYGVPTGEQVSAKLRIGRAAIKENDPKYELRDVEEQLINMEPGQQYFSFRYRFTQTGKHVIQVQLQDDDLNLDNVRSVVLDVREKVPVLIVNGKPAADPYQRASEFLLDAIDPYQGERRPVDKPFEATVIESAQFADAGRGDLSKYDCVFFCDVPQFNPAESRRLISHVKKRGGIIFCLGPQVNLKAYNDELYNSDGTGLLPTRLLGVESAPKGYEYHFTDESDSFRRPPLEVFAKDWHRTALMEVPFQKYIRLKPLEPQDIPYRAPRTILSFMGQRDPTVETPAPPPANLDVRFPAIVSWQPPLPEKHEEPEETLVRQPGRGQVIVFPSTVNRAWNQWPRRPSFTWVMQELLRYATASRLREQTYLVGQVLEDYLPGRGGKPVKFSLPGERQQENQTLDRDDFSVLRFVETTQSGVYRANVGTSKRDYLFAVNVPSMTASQTGSESDPSRISNDQMESLYPDWDFQIVKKVSEAKHKKPTTPEGTQVTPQFSELGTAVARWLLLITFVLMIAEVVLAWIFGHYSAVHEKQMTGKTQLNQNVERWLRIGLTVALCLIVLFTAFLTFTLIHELITDDFLGFLPQDMRQSVENSLGIPPPAPGESTKWELDYLPYLVDEKTDPWLIGFVGLAAAVLIIGIYSQERRIASQPGVIHTEDVGETKPKRRPNLGSFLLFCTLRILLVIAMLAVLLPQIRLYFKRQSWPSVVIILDDSASMSTVDDFSDEKLKTMVQQLAQKGNLTKAERLGLAQTLLTKDGTDWMTELLTNRKAKVHLYRCSSRAERLLSLSSAEEIPEALNTINNLKAVPKNDVSRLGIALRQVINDFEGHSLAGILMLTDGVTTEGDSIVDVSRYAARSRIPLFFVGIGDALERPDIILSELQVADSVLVNDNLVFQLKVAAKGYGGGRGIPQIKVKLFEKGNERPLTEKSVTIDESGRAIDVKLEHRPTKPGEKSYIVKTEVRPEEIDRNNNQLGPRRVYVHEAKLIKVLYVEGYGRWEFHYLKTLLSRESNRAQNKKSMDLKYVLMNADADFHLQDKNALKTLPTKAQLNEFDVVILGDVNADPERDAEDRTAQARELMEKYPDFLQNLREFVLEKGGGLVVLSGERYSPHTLKDTPLATVLPIDMVTERQPPEPAEGYITDYRPELTAIGERHPIFSFNAQNNAEIWQKLQPIFWWSEGYKLKPAAEVLAVHPGKQALPDRASGESQHPLIVQQFAGAGRCLFLGINETWRWRWREGELRYNQFWIQVIRYLARSRQGRVTLRLNKQVPYTRGEPITITVRFPDDSPPPPKNTEVRVKMQRRSQRTNEQETRTIRLQYVQDSRATYTGTVTRTPEGQYRFWLDAPSLKGAIPEAEALVLSPPGEMEQLRMNEDDMKQAARETRGRFYTLLNARDFLNDLPTGERMSLSAPGPPFTLWNQWWMFTFVLLLMTTEWILRKRRHLL